MLANEFLEMILEERKTEQKIVLNETEQGNIYETASIISGNLVYPLCRELWLQQISIEDITKHFEKLYDNENFHGIIYIFYIMLDAMNIVVPYEFVSLAASDIAVPILSEAIIDDWLEFEFVENDSQENE